MGNCNAPDWDGKAMPRPPLRTRQLVDPMAAFQMVHIMEGVVQRGTATVLRDLNRPLFGKTGTTNGPTNVWFVGGTPDIVAGVYLGYDQPRPMGGYAQGGRIAAPIFKQWALTALKDQPKVPFVAPPGIRLVADRPRARGKRVFGVFPTSEDPQAAVIWEAFKPQTEPRRTLSAARSAIRTISDAAAGGAAGAAASSVAAAATAQAATRDQPAAATARPSPAAASRRRLACQRRTRSNSGVRRATHLQRELRPCAPKRRPISTRSMPRPRCCAGSSTGTAR